MKNLTKVLVGFLLTVSVLVSGLCFSTSAAGSVISFSKSTLTVGDSLTVTVTIDAGEAMYGVSCIVNYNSDVLEYKSGNAVGGAGTLKIIESPSGETKVSYSLTFSAKAAGSCAVSVADCVYSALSEDKGLNGASATVTVNNAALSSNANLKSLSVSTGKLSPSFSASRTSYTVSVGNDVTECAVYATAADSGAKVSVSGTSALKMGANTRTVTVTAPNGSQKTYTVTINRSSEEDTVSDDTTPDPLETNIEGVSYTVAADISSIPLFKGFAAEQIDYNGTQISVAKDTNGYYTLYYLKSADSDALVPYTYNETDKVFTKLLYCTQGEYSYIFADLPEDSTVPSDYYSTNVEISGMNVKSFADSKAGMSDFYYIYCFVDGSYNFYRYDSRENVLQRYPELTLQPLEELTVDENEASGGIIARFSTLSGNAKIIVLGLILVIIGAIALLVLFIIKLVRKKNDFEFDDNYFDSDGFDQTSISNFSLLTDEDSPVETETEPDTEAPAPEESVEEVETELITDEPENEE